MPITVIATIKKRKEFVEKKFELPNTQYVIDGELVLIYHYDEKINEYVLLNVDSNQTKYPRTASPVWFVIRDLTEKGIEFNEAWLQTSEKGLNC
ncbi:MAG: hypothetical protein E7374_02365 [Clostridiales bacterium]|nr:hypothetical protein [Clostridiales bacterium]